MPCVSPDGKPSESGVKMLGSVSAGKTSVEDIAAASGMPLFRVPSGLRELAEAGYVAEQDGRYSLTDLGRAAL